MCFLKEEECFTGVGTQDDGGDPLRIKLEEERWLWNPTRQREPQLRAKGTWLPDTQPLKVQYRSRTLNEE